MSSAARDEKVEAYVDQLTAGKGFDVVFDTIGGNNLRTSLAAAAESRRAATTNARKTQDLATLHARALSIHVIFMLLPMDLAAMYNPCIRGWINYYSHFYKMQLRPTLKRIDLYVIRWARRKFKRLRRKTKGARDWFDRLRRVNPTLFAHWQLCHGNGRTSGAV
ncbi:MAG TPA: group II intron maturase-specific domain-containing protein [Candidatus Sulfotelmatobacter sp.]